MLAALPSLPEHESQLHRGGTYSANYTIMVASTITVAGNSALSANFSSLTTGNPVKKVTLAE